MIRLEGSRLFVEADGSDKGTLDAGYDLADKFKVVLTATGGRITIQYANLVTDVSKTIAFQPAVDNKQWYFKAGCYTQANTSNGTGHGEVVIYDLDVTHS